MRARLVLEDGYSLEGQVFAGDGEIAGEVVFNTSMTGYQEIITDPSYKGQIVTLTYPLIGNYGTNQTDMESARPQIEALLVREYSPLPSNWRADKTLSDFLSEAGILGVEGIDTRALTRHIRLAGAMRGVLTTSDDSVEDLTERARSHPSLVGRDMVQYVTCSESYVFCDQGRYNVAVMDFGVKTNILRMLKSAGCRLTVFPAYTKAEEILAAEPDGILLSNGPGDPAGLPGVVAEIRKLLGLRPIFGICLGHQLLGLAMGLSTYKLKFGHRGGNHPVKNLDTGRVEITSQNHGFCVHNPADGEGPKTGTGTSRAPADLRITHINLNDGTLEGMESPELCVKSVQYHPEASPGPHDADYLFRDFVAMMEGGR